MAIYQPTYCEPFLSTEDFSQISDNNPLYLYCKIASSNFDVNGYRIVLLDENNNLVFAPGVDFDSYPLQTPTSLKIGQISYIKNLSQVAGEPNTNSGRNGTFLKIPFAIESDIDYDWGTNDGAITKNQISSRFLQNGMGYKWIITLYQLEPTQPTLQEPDREFILPLEVKYYDVILASGVITGSAPKRIQTMPSDEILQNYFVQPVYIPNLKPDLVFEPDLPPEEVNWLPSEAAASWKHKQTGTTIDTDIVAVGPRGRIYSYDNTLGHIYPQIDVQGAWANIINRKQWLNSDSTSDSATVANGVQIFKQSSNIEDLTESQKVKAVPNEHAIPWKWEQNAANESLSRGVQTIWVAGDSQASSSWMWDALVDNPNSPYYPFDSKSLGTENPEWGLPEFEQCTISIDNGDRIVLNCQPSSNFTGNYNYEWPRTPNTGLDPTEDPSPYNGIYRAEFGSLEWWDIQGQSRTKKTSSDGANWVKLTVYWYRAPDADTWGELVNKIVFVTEQSHTSFSNQNIQVDIGDPATEATGIINTTPVKFEQEKPVVLYNYNSDNNPDINTVGLILYNNTSATSKEIIPASTLFLKPLANLENGHALQLSGTNTWGVLHHIDSVTWSAQLDLVVIEVPEGVTAIGDDEFANDTSIRKIVLPNGLKTIAAGAFQNCTNLQEISIPDTIESVGEDAFENCPNLAYTTYGGGAYLGNPTNPYAVLVKPAVNDIEILTVNANTYVIADDAFSEQTELASIIFEGEV